SRRRHTRSDRDWSSDVCSSDLGQSGGFCLVVVQLVAVVLAAHRSPRTASAKPSSCLGAAAAHADGDFDLLPELCCAAESAALPGAAADAQRNGSPENIDQNAKAASRSGSPTRSCSRSVACTWLAASRQRCIPLLSAEDRCAKQRP